MNRTETEAGIFPVPSTAGLGTAVIVHKVVVAWFADFTEEARDWCTENHFGEWLPWRAKAPEIVPLTEAEYNAVMREGRDLAAKLKEAPNAKITSSEAVRVA